MDSPSLTEAPDSPQNVLLEDDITGENNSSATLKTSADNSEPSTVDANDSTVDTKGEIEEQQEKFSPESPEIAVQPPETDEDDEVDENGLQRVQSRIDVNARFDHESNQIIIDMCHTDGDSPAAVYETRLRALENLLPKFKTLPQAQEVVGKIEAKINVGNRDDDSGHCPSSYGQGEKYVPAGLVVELQDIYRAWQIVQKRLGLVLSIFDLTFDEEKEKIEQDVRQEHLQYQQQMHRQRFLEQQRMEMLMSQQQQQQFVNPNMMFRPGPGDMNAQDFDDGDFLDVQKRRSQKPKKLPPHLRKKISGGEQLKRPKAICRGIDIDDGYDGGVPVEEIPMGTTEAAHDYTAYVNELPYIVENPGANQRFD